MINKLKKLLDDNRDKYKVLDNRVIWKKIDNDFSIEIKSQFRKIINKIGEFNKISLLSLLTTENKYFVFPFFQRAYVWDEENVSDFTKTLNQISKTIGKDKNSKTFPFGSITLQQTEKSNIFEVLDGQQRIITSMLLFSAISNYLAYRNGEKNEISEFISRNIFKSNSGDFKLQKSKFNTNFFINKIFSNELSDYWVGEGDLHLSSELLTKFNVSTSETSRLLENYNLLLDWVIENLPMDSGLDKLERNIYNIFQIFSIITVDSSNLLASSNKVQHFESLNSTGKKLERLDILKNKIFSYFTPSEQNEKNSTIWKPIKDFMYKNSLYFDWFVFESCDLFFEPRKRNNKLHEQFDDIVLKKAESNRVDQKSIVERLMVTLGEFFRIYKILTNEEELNLIFKDESGTTTDLSNDLVFLLTFGKATYINGYSDFLVEHYIVDHNFFNASFCLRSVMYAIRLFELSILLEVDLKKILQAIKSMFFRIYISKSDFSRDMNYRYDERMVELISRFVQKEIDYSELLIHFFDVRYKTEEYGFEKNRNVFVLMKNSSTIVEGFGEWWFKLDSHYYNFDAIKLNISSTFLQQVPSLFISEKKNSSFDSMFNIKIRFVMKLVLLVVSNISMQSSIWYECWNNFKKYEVIQQVVRECVVEQKISRPKIVHHFLSDFKIDLHQIFNILFRGYDQIIKVAIDESNIYYDNSKSYIENRLSRELENEFS